MRFVAIEDDYSGRLNVVLMCYDCGKETILGPAPAVSYAIEAVQNHVHDK